MTSGQSETGPLVYDNMGGWRALLPDEDAKFVELAQLRKLWIFDRHVFVRRPDGRYDRWRGASHVGPVAP